jgi:putative mycofactocin binding protein MftB
MPAAQAGAAPHDAVPAGAATPPGGQRGPASTTNASPRWAGFAPDRPYRISGSVSVRPESFGALVYDFHTRRLSFLKARLLVRVVETLADHPDVHAALAAAEVPAPQREQYLKALAGLATAGTITPREDAP